MRRDMNRFRGRKIGESRAEHYSAYLRSEMWREKREIVLKRCKRKCVCCGGEAVQVHHWRYPRHYGWEKYRELSGICVDCHQDLHENYKGRLKWIRNMGRDDFKRELKKLIKEIRK